MKIVSFIGAVFFLNTAEVSAQSCDGAQILSSLSTFLEYTSQWQYLCSDDEAKRVSPGHSGAEVVERMRKYIPKAAFDGLKILEKLNPDFVRNRVELRCATALEVRCYDLRDEVDQNGIDETVLGSYEDIDRVTPLILIRFATKSLEVLDPQSKKYLETEKDNGKKEAEKMRNKTGDVVFHELLHFFKFDNLRRYMHDSFRNREKDAVYSCTAQVYPSAPIKGPEDRREYWTNTQAACKTCVALRAEGKNPRGLTRVSEETQGSPTNPCSVNEQEMFVGAASNR